MRVILTPNAEHLRRMREIGPNLRVAFVQSMSDPALLRALGTVHAAQEAEIFASEGAVGAGGKFAPLNPRYAARKAKVAGRRKILDLTGTLRDQFTRKTDPAYIEQYVPTSETTGLFRFGAASAVGAAHRFGNPMLAPPPSGLAAKIFGGRALRLPVRDMISKTPAMVAELREALLTWFTARLRQLVRAQAALGGR